MKEKKIVEAEEFFRKKIQEHQNNLSSFLERRENQKIIGMSKFYDKQAEREQRVISDLIAIKNAIIEGEIRVKIFHNDLDAEVLELIKKVGFDIHLDEFGMIYLIPNVVENPIHWIEEESGEWSEFMQEEEQEEEDERLQRLLLWFIIESILKK